MGGRARRADHGGMDDTSTTATATTAVPRRLTRVSHDRVIAGVAGGLGRYFRVDPVVFRIALVALAVAGLVAIVATTGVPLQGGVGDRAWHPASTGELHRAYHLGVGNLRVDLSDLELRPGTTRLDATVGVGHLLVRVPAQAE